MYCWMYFLAKALYNVGIMRLTGSLRRVVLVLVLIFSVVPCAVVSAQQASSTNYSTKEYYFGTGGETNQTSTNYKSRSATGALGVGNTSSTNYAAAAGSITPQDEYIELVVNASTLNLGVQSLSAASTGTATFYVKAYVASGYVVRNASTGPTYGGYTMASPSSLTASAVGTEQFGINLVANTLPATFGANAVQVPDNTFSFGTAATGYNTTNQYKYVNGDTIAQSTKSSGQTTFTISYIMNISTVTRAGTYTMNHILVATGTY